MCAKRKPRFNSTEIIMLSCKNDVMGHVTVVINHGYAISIDFAYVKIACYNISNSKFPINAIRQI